MAILNFHCPGATHVSVLPESPKGVWQQFEIMSKMGNPASCPSMPSFQKPRLNRQESSVLKETLNILTCADSSIDTKQTET